MILGDRVGRIVDDAAVVGGYGRVRGTLSLLLLLEIGPQGHAHVAVAEEENDKGNEEIGERIPDNVGLECRYTDLTYSVSQSIFLLGNGSSSRNVFFRPFGQGARGETKRFWC